VNGAAGTSFLWISLLMVVAGIGIPLMATLSSGLGQALQSPVAATAIMFGGGLVLTLGILAFTGVPSGERLASASPGFYFGAIFLVLYGLSITWAAPRIGLGNAIFFVLFGQIIAAAAIDHFGLWGAIQSSITLKRVAGIVLMLVGVYLARKTV